MSLSRAEQIVDDARRVAEQEPSGRLPVPSFVSWSVFPFEGELQVKPVADPEIPEPPRHGVDGVDCGLCARPDEDCVWSDDDWRVTTGSTPSGLPVVLTLEPRGHYDLAQLPPELLASFGTMIWRIERAVLSLGGIARVQLARWGDGAEHLHLWFFARPEGFLQGRGTCLTLWNEVLPPRPDEEWRRNLEQVRRSLDEA